MSNYYENVAELYRNASAEMRKLSREHWTKCHKANVQSKRKDLIIFSAQILAAYDLIDAESMQ